MNNFLNSGHQKSDRGLAPACKVMILSDLFLTIAEPISSGWEAGQIRGPFAPVQEVPSCSTAPVINNLNHNDLHRQDPVLTDSKAGSKISIIAYELLNEPAAGLSKKNEIGKVMEKAGWSTLIKIDKIFPKNYRYN